MTSVLKLFHDRLLFAQRSSAHGATYWRLLSIFFTWGIPIISGAVTYLTSQEGRRWPELIFSLSLVLTIFTVVVAAVNPRQSYAHSVYYSEVFKNLESRFENAMLKIDRGDTLDDHAKKRQEIELLEKFEKELTGHIRAYNAGSLFATTAVPSRQPDATDESPSSGRVSGA